jgi:zona occludens toxin
LVRLNYRLLETHRHYGVDFWLISQGSHLFDNFIRLLVGRHVHLVANWTGRKQYEWSECKQDLTSKTDAIVRPYKLPKHISKYYDSAEVHTKLDRRKPLSFYGLIVLLLIAVGLIYFIVKRVNARVDPVTPIEQTDNKASTPKSEPVADTKLIGAYPDFKPIYEGIPESAPAYAELIKVTAAPTLMGCIYSKAKDDCRCYTKQATIYPTSKEYCVESVKGHRFNPYFVPSITTANSSESKESQNVATR